MPVPPFLVTILLYNVTGIFSSQDLKIFLIFVSNMANALIPSIACSKDDIVPVLRTGLRG